MKSLYEQEKELFARHADVAGGKYISADKARQLLGKDAVRYALNVAKGDWRFTLYANMWGNGAEGTLIDVLTFDGFSKAFHYFWVVEVRKGIHNAYQTPDYLARPEFA